MAVCTFFGHRDCPAEIQKDIETAILDLIQNYEVTDFYVGNQGLYDGMVRSTLRKLQGQFPHIRYAVVLAYLPKGKSDEFADYSDTMLPEGIELVHPQYALAWRNKWMIDQSDYVVTYVTHGWGGAAKYAEMAKRKGKQVISLV